MQLFLSATPEQPLLASGDLLLSTDEDSEVMYYSCSGTNLVLPTNLVIEAELRYLSGTGSVPGRTACIIGFTVAPNVGGLLFIEHDNIFLGHGYLDKGTNAAVDTDDTFHTYRVEVDTSTSSGIIKVFQDAVLVLRDVMLTSGPNVNPVPEIYFGDGSSSAYGASRWRSFHHNAAAQQICLPPVVQIRLSQVEVSWNSCSNHLYSVQYRSDLTTNTWVDLFTNVLATNTETSVFDEMPRGRPQRFYRVQTLP
jgi:hypothetical protein